MLAEVSGSSVKAETKVEGSLQLSSLDRERPGVAAQAPSALSPTSIEEDVDPVPYSSCDEVELMLSKVRKTAEALKKFCLENRNVHLQIKTWENELMEQ